MDNRITYSQNNTIISMRALILNLFLLILTGPLMAQLPTDFNDVLISDNWSDPVGVSFDERGRGYVWEKGGKVFLLDSNDVKIPQPLIDISEEVLNWWDHGMLGFTLDPYFYENGYFYLFYVVDRHHLLHYGTDRYDPDSTYTRQATIGRITRFTADESTGFTTTIPGSRKVLVGETKESGFPIIMLSHGVGSLVFGEDGTLLASCGDSGSFTWSDAGSHPDTFWEQAIDDGIMDAKDNVGAYRAQILNSLNGKMIRIDAATGDGIPSNPYYDSSDPRAPRSRVWATGIRNAYRTILWPGTGGHEPSEANPGILLAGDVGSIYWEELNLIREGGQNFGWPIFEGVLENIKFGNLVRENQYAPNPAYPSNNCNEFLTFHELINQPGGGSPTIQCNPGQQIPDSLMPRTQVWPEIAWSNAKGGDTLAVIGRLSDQGEVQEITIEQPESYAQGTNFNGFSPMPGFFYSGTNFPTEYEGKLFMADYSGWIKVLTFDDSQILRKVEDFHTDAKDVVHLSLNPKTGVLYYLTLEDHLLRKIEYGGNPPPIVVLEADQTFGPGTLPVQFDATNSYAPKGWPLTYHWDFGDGEESTEAQPLHIFQTTSNSPTSFTVKLTVTDSLGDSAVKTQLVSINNTPPQVRISSIEDGSFYAMGGSTWYPMEADVTDIEHAGSDLTYSWQTFLYHNTHNHPNPVVSEINTGILLDPLGCNGEEFSYLFTLTVTDAEGLSATDEARIFPNCEPFPAEGLTLSGEATNDLVQLTWNSTNEQSLNEYIIERFDGANFAEIGRRPALGSGAYTFDDLSPFRGTNIYRLKLLRTDARFDYSEEVQVKFPADLEYTIYPNPATAFFFVELKSITDQATFSLYGSDGKLIRTDSWSSSLPRKIPVDDLANGVYIYRLNNGVTEFVGEVVIGR